MASAAKSLRLCHCFPLMDQWLGPCPAATSGGICRQTSKQRKTGQDYDEKIRKNKAAGMIPIVAPAVFAASC
jgi:hypothetical protein